MIGSAIKWGLLILVAAAVVQSIPDLARYIKIRQM